MKQVVKIRSLRLFPGIIVPFAVAIGLLTSVACRPTATQIDNPYAGIDWVADGQYKANLHTHTTLSGGASTPDVVIDLYRELGYGILALTDHDDDSVAVPIWPWQSYGRDPEALGMVAIQGNEISDVHHIGSHFNDYGAPGVESEDVVLKEIGRRGGTALFHHPGRYDKGVDWYVDMHRRYDHLLGQEVYNRNDRYPEDRQTWDAILTEILPERSVWGFASDDMHNTEKDPGISWIVVVVPDLTNELVREAIEGGRFFFVNDPNGQERTAAPAIKAITVSEAAGTIQIEAAAQDSILWISQGDIIHRGDRLSWAETPGVGKYVRAEVYGADGIVVGTQPFQIH
ncbi:PHP domain-containing protein [Candidatus Neomarinimicrobiota bacterium]